MLCQYCGTPLAPGSTECTICGSQSSSYGSSSGQGSYGALSYSSQSTQQYGTQSDSYNSQIDYAAPATQIYNPSGSYSSQSDYSPQQYGAQSYSQSNGYGAQNAYSMQQQYGAQSYSQSNGYGAQNAYSMQQQYSAQPYGYTPQQYGAQQGYVQPNAYSGNSYYSQGGAAYGSPAYGRSAAGGSATSVASAAIRSLVVSPLFIIAISLACVAMCLGIAIAFTNGEIVDYSYRYYYDNSALASFASSFTSICMMGDLINSLPYLIMMIGFWVALGSMASGRSIPFGTGGFTCIKVGLVFRTVLSCITGGVIMVLFLITIIAGSRILEDIIDEYGYYFFGDIGSLGLGALFIVFALFIAYFVLRCIYYAKQTKSLNIARTTAAQGIFNINMSMYVIVCNFILAAMHLATAIYFYDVALLLIRHLAQSASLITMSIAMIMYRNTIDYVRGYSVPVHMS